MNVHRSVAGWLLATTACAVSASTAWADGEITVGTGKWDQSAPEAKYQEFVHYPQGSFLYSLMLIQGQGRNQISILSQNVLQKDQQTAFAWTNGARFRLDVLYGQIPHNFSQVSRSQYTEVEPGSLVLDDNIQEANQSDPPGYTNRMTDYLNASPNIALTHRTDRYGARAKVRPATGWNVQGAVVQQKKTGNKAYGGSFGFSDAIEIWEPIRHRTTDAEVNAGYQNQKIALRAAGGVSVFENLVDDLIWDNPKRLTDTTNAGAAGQIDLYPDNRALYGNLALTLRLPSRTALSGTVGLRTIQQDDDWLPYTTNTALTQPNDPANALPGTNTDGKATALTADLRATTRVLGPVGASARFNYYDYDNKTPSFVLPGYSRVDAGWTAGPLTTHPYGNSRMKLSGDLRYRPVSRLLLEAGAEWNQREHTLREVEEDQEVAGFGRATLRLTNRFSLDAKYRYGNRVADEFHIEEYQTTSGTFHEQPGLRRFDVANRRQQLADAALHGMFGEAADVQLRYQYARNIYPDSDLGLQDQQGNDVGLDLTYHPEGRVELTGGGGWSQFDAQQVSRTSNSGTVSSNPNDDWTALLRDRNWYGYADLELDIEPDVWTLQLGYEFSWAKGEYLLSNPTDTAQDLPATRYVRHIALADLEYEMWRDTDVGIRYVYDSYDVEDFASQNIPLINPASASETGAAANAIFLGDNSLPYTAHRVALYLTRRF